MGLGETHFGITGVLTLRVDILEMFIHGWLGLISIVVVDEFGGLRNYAGLGIEAFTYLNGTNAGLYATMII